MEPSKYRTTKDELEEINKMLFLEFEDTIAQIQNPILLILQSHLYFENLLERFLVSELPHGDTLVKKGNLTFYQKVMAVNAIGVFEQQIIDSLLKYNGLRNALAHKFGHSIEKKQVSDVGRTLGSVYSRIELQAEGCLAKEIHLISAYIAGCVGSNTHLSESLESVHS